MTRKALEKLTPRQAAYCRTLSALIHRARLNGLQAEWENKRGKLRGFLECMVQLELLTVNEMRSLYLFFISEDRSKTEF